MMESTSLQCNVIFRTQLLLNMSHKVEDRKGEILKEQING